jgi:predicted DsbA family dithiol-disulfide isomerase
VKRDIQEAQMIGVSGVPFFVVDRKYAISGAQESKTFVNTLRKAWEEHPPQGKLPDSEKGPAAACTPEGQCD